MVLTIQKDLTHTQNIPLLSIFVDYLYDNTTI